MLASGPDFKPNSYCLVQLMALLLLRHALSVSDGDNSDDDPSNFFSVSDLSFFFLVKFFPCPMFYWFQNAMQSPPNLLTIFCSFSCFVPLDFYYLATSWLGQSVFCSVGDKDKSVLIIVINIFSFACMCLVSRYRIDSECRIDFRQFFTCLVLRWRRIQNWFSWNNFK